MVKLGERIQEADWKTEKHVPVIDGPDEVKANEIFAHPNTTEHHIRWITLFFHGEGEKFSVQVGHYEFTGHGESAQGPNMGPVYTHPAITTSFKINKPGTLYALALCNIHGLWQSAKEIKVNN
jgi:superoxide reductase